MQMKMRVPPWSLALGYAAVATASISGSPRFPPRDRGPLHRDLLNHRRSVWTSAFISPSDRDSCRTKALSTRGPAQRRRISLQASSSSGGGNSGDSLERRTARNKRTQSTASPQQINAYTKQQISTIFGTSNKSNFVPLSFAGRWSQQRQPSDENKQQVRGGIETILLSSLEQCQAMEDAYHQFLTSSNALNDDDDDDDDEYESKMNALPIPLSPSSTTPAIKLLSQSYTSKPLSKSVLLSLNSLFLNRDDGLFDNLPWSTWSVDPALQERDAANNVVEKKFSMGKRVAYQRFMGKDWQGRSLSLGNMVNRVKYLLERSDSRCDDGEHGDVNAGGRMEEEDVMLSLSMRLLQLEMKEAQMEIAEAEQNLAIAKTQSTATAASEMDGEGVVATTEENEAKNQLEKARERLQLAESSLEELETAMQSPTENDSTAVVSFSLPWRNAAKNNDDTKKQQQQQSKTQSLIMSIIDQMTTQENPPPYRGAIGYPAKLDTKEEVFEDSILPYTSPYDLLLEILDEQLNSEVMGCVLEPTSLLEGNLVLGGAILLKRKGVEKSTTLSGETVSYTDDDDDLGNEGVLPRSMYVVECFSDEAIGMAMASHAPIFVEEEIVERAGNVQMKLDVDKARAVKTEYAGEDGGIKDVRSLSFVNRVPPICPTDDTFYSSTQVEGEAVSSEKEANFVRIPLTTNPQLFASDPIPQSTSERSSSVFSTFNPVKSLDEYDELTNEGKVRLLLKLESFKGVLPRPRAVRASTQNINNKAYEDGSSPPSLVDDMLIPLIDESIRRQYRIRDAERRKDFNEADALRSEVSPRQAALEKAQQARSEGLDLEAQLMEEEAELYKSLRADITQDEGAYSRFLDRDDWYERETQARIKKLDKSKFGTLLDGIDLP